MRIKIEPKPLKWRKIKDANGRCDSHRAKTTDGYHFIYERTERRAGFYWSYGGREHKYPSLDDARKAAESFHKRSITSDINSVMEWLNISIESSGNEVTA